MAEARKALAEVVCVTAVGRTPVSQPTASPARLGWLFFCSDFLAVVLGLSSAAVVDLAFAPAVGLASLAAVPAGVAMAPSRLAIGLLPGIGAAIVFWISGHYGWRRASWYSFAEVALTMGLSGAVHLVATSLAFPGDGLFPVAIGWLIATAVLVAAREAIRSRLVESGDWFEPAVLIANHDRAAGLADTVSADPDLALRITQIVNAGGPAIAGSADADPGRRDAPVIRSGDVLGEIFFRFRRRTILFCPPPDDVEMTERLLRLAGAAGCRLGLVLPGAGFGRSVGQDHYMLADGSTLIWLSDRLGQPFWRAAKRAVDIAGSAFLLLVLTPLFALLTLPALVSGQPVFFAHRRVGKDGRRFACYKFRTMVVDAEALLQRLLASDENARKEWESSYKLKNDPRVTPVGSFLRRTSLDELPQLWNVLRGDMSLVGPRPVVDRELRRYGEDAITYLSVRPGITGLWQVSGRCDTSYDLRVAYDRWYVRNWTFGRDIAILMKTVWIVLSRTGAY